MPPWPCYQYEYGKYFFANFGTGGNFSQNNSDQGSRNGADPALTDMLRNQYLVLREILGVYSDDHEKGCVHIPEGALIIVTKEAQPFLWFSWENRTLRAFAVDIQERSLLLPHTLAQYASKAV